MDKLEAAILSLSELTAKDYDLASIAALAQLQYYLHKSSGIIFIKTVGRMASCFEGGKIHLDTPAGKE